MDQRLKAEGGLGRSPAVTALTAAAAGAVLLIPLPFIGVPLSFVALVIGAAHLRGSSRYRRSAWAAVAIASVTLIAALVPAPCHWGQMRRRVSDWARAVRVSTISVLLSEGISRSSVYDPGLYTT